MFCEGGDSNPHELPRYHLKVVRLPVPPPPLGERSGILAIVVDLHKEFYTR